MVVDKFFYLFGLDQPIGRKLIELFKKKHREKIFKSFFHWDLFLRG